MADNTQEKYILLAVNGTLMRGLELEGNLREERETDILQEVPWFRRHGKKNAAGCFICGKCEYICACYRRSTPIPTSPGPVCTARDAVMAFSIIRRPSGIPAISRGLSSSDASCP